MLANVQTGLVALGSANGAGVSAVAAQPQVAGLVDEAATSFMMESPAVLQFVREALPGNRLLATPGAATFEELQRALENKSPSAPSVTVNIPLGVISAGLAIQAAIIVGNLAYEVIKSAPVGGTVIAVGVTIAGAVGVFTGFTWGYSRVARFLERGWFSFVSQKGVTRQLDEVRALLADPTEIEHFFAQNPKEYHSFLKGSVSQTFRTKEAQARIRIDALRAKVGEAVRKQEERLREIEASDIPESDKQLLSERVRISIQEPMGKFNEAIGKEEAFVEQLNAFIEEISEMAVAIDREVAARNVYASVEQYEAEMKVLAETAVRAEEARIEALIDLSAYWERLREMGDNVLHLQEAHQEISRMLLDSPS